MKNLRNSLNNYRTATIFVVLALLVTLIFGSIYTAVQQTYRMNANDPQIEVTGQVADVINQDVPLDSIVSGADQVDMNNSLSLFVMLFDKDKKLAGSSATLDGKPPTPPSGTFDVAGKKGDDRFTWEPKKGVRIAAVLKKVGDKGYVLAGRSLKEVESRVDNLTKMIGLAWLVSLVLAFVLSMLLRPRQTLTIVEETNVTVNNVDEGISNSDDESGSVESSDDNLNI